MLQHNLGGLAHAEGRFEDGADHAFFAVALRRAASDSTSLAVAEDLAALAANLLELGLYDACEHALDDARSLLREAKLDQHYQSSVVLHLQAASFERRGRLGAADAAYERALQIKADVLRPTHPEVARLRKQWEALGDRPAGRREPGGG